MDNAMELSGGAIGSWGRVTRAPVTIQHTAQAGVATGQTRLAYGLGRSYGDVCLNGAGRLLWMQQRRRWLAADWQRGIVRVEAGVSLDELLRVAVPRGWFPMVLPGTRWVTVGGAIANDVHGKNHHCEGTFGDHVLKIGLLRSDREALIECSAEQETGLFRASIGGIGLTGVILWAELRLQPIQSALMDVQFEPIATLEDFQARTQAGEAEWPYTVAWVDLMRAERNRLPGIFMSGKHRAERGPLTVGGGALFGFQRDWPVCPLNGITVKAFNSVYGWRQRLRKGRFVQHYSPFFHPLDVVAGWNRLYGRNGFYQYQCVLPKAGGLEPVRAILDCLRQHKAVVPLAVFKQTADRAPAGLLSFPVPGWTLAMDLPNQGARTARLFSDLDALVAAAGGRLYTAKDACMAADFFQASYPQWRQLEALRDPSCDSDFWRRVTGRA